MERSLPEMQKRGAGAGWGSDLDTWSWRYPSPTASSLPQHLQHWAGAGGGRRTQTLSAPHAQVDSEGMSLPVQLGPGAHVWWEQGIVVLHVGT